MKIYIPLLLVITLVSCGSQQSKSNASVAHGGVKWMKESECANQDWFALGEADAKEGAHVRVFETYKKLCGEQMPESAKSRFVDGYTKGIIHFCTARNGYDLGLVSEDRSANCPPELRSDFLLGYNRGQEQLKATLRWHDQETDRQARNKVQQIRQSSTSAGGGN
jgi:major membrane immunogen (membrane-anchored lipoprotein)